MISEERLSATGDSGLEMYIKRLKEELSDYKL